MNVADSVLSSPKFLFKAPLHCEPDNYLYIYMYIHAATRATRR